MTKFRLPKLLALVWVWGSVNIGVSSLLYAGTTGQSDTLRIMDYNLLDYPGSDAATRDPYFRAVVHSAKPDILVVEEMTSQAGVNTFLTDVMDYYQSGLYSTIPFNNGPDTDPHIYYKSSRVTFLSASYFLMEDNLRNIAVYMLKDNATGDTIRLYAVHLKASTGYESDRLAEATALRDTLNKLAVGTKFMVMGDFNFYKSSTEPGFTKLTESETNNNGRLKDPINQVGDWHDNPAYALYDTQSPRTRQFGGGANGGMDDRFDFILTSYSSLESNTIVSSYKAYGNDGNHLNDSINHLPNTAVPDSVANGLAYASDHIPVVCDFKFTNASGTGAFVQISPSNAASSQPISGTLTWHSSASATSYDVYLGSSNPPTTKVSADQTDTTYAYASLTNNTTYYWKIVAKAGSGSTDATGSPWSFTTIVAAPGSFSLTSPGSGATSQPVSGTLSWGTSANATGYDVYLGTSNPPTTKVSSNQAGTSYGYGGLANSTPYYWKVVARNTADTTIATGSPWSFTTIVAAPGAFNLTSPTNNSTNQAIAGTLSWQSSTNASGYDVYLDTSNPPTTVVSSNQASTSYSYSGLSNSTTYYWKVVARNVGGNTAATGSPWSFTTIIVSPSAFRLLHPSNGAIGEPVSGSLTWQSSDRAEAYDVYLDTINPPAILVSLNNAGATYGYSGLLNGKVYYWNVVAKNAGGTTVATDAPQSFTSTFAQAPDAFLLVSPPTGASGRPLSGTLEWNPSDSADSYDVFLDTLNPPVATAATGITTTSHSYSGLHPGTAYYWKVIARNAHGATVASNAPSSFSTAYLPAPPGELSSASVTTTSIQLSWVDSAGNEDGYRVMRAATPAGPFAQVGVDLPANTVSFVDTGLSVNRRYYYRVLPFNIVGEGNFAALNLATLASVPAIASLTSPNYSTIKVNIAPGINPASTEYAIQAGSDSMMHYVQANGKLGPAASWRTYAGWDSTAGAEVEDLVSCTRYTILVKARNEDSVETAVSEGVAQATVCFAVTHRVSGGWNLLSVPISVTDVRRSALFPYSISNAFSYMGRYVVNDTMRNGIGFWLKFGRDSLNSLVGQPCWSDTMTLHAGWNIVGSISAAVNVGAIGQDPNGVVTSMFFGYDGSYGASDSVVPMKGYWVKARAEGKLIMSASPVLAKTRNAFSAKELLSGMNSLMFEDQAGHRQSLYFGASDVDGSSLMKFEMPPLPPTGVFDVRFASQRFVEIVPRDGQTLCEFPIAAQGIVYPLKVSWHLNAVEGVAYEIFDGKQSVALRGSGMKVIADGEVSLRLRARVAAGAALPKEFRLEQNYPNPFNPVTVIRYELPVDGYVTLIVYDVLGREVTTLADGVQDGGYKTVEWNSLNAKGTAVGSGMYFYRLSAVSLDGTQRFAETRKMILAR